MNLAKLTGGIRRDVVVLGFVSLLTDVSSEMLYPIIPLYLTAVLHAPMSVVGLIEGLAESTASLLKLASGMASDRSGRRRPFVVAGYGLSAVSKPLLALASSWPLLLAVRLVDRTGKGIRGPARDAMIAAATPAADRGRAFGFHRALDTVGAILGPLIALLAIGVLGLGYRTIFLLATVPAVGGVLLLRALDRKRPAPPAPEPAAPAVDGPPDRRLYAFLVVIGVFSLGNSSNVFLLLRARDLGYSETGVIGLYVLYNLVYAIAATPAGQLADRIGRRRVLLAALGIATVVYVGFALAASQLAVALLMAFYGLFAAANAGASRAYVASLASSERRATIMGAYQMVTSGLLLVASTVAGLLWTHVGPHAPFWFGAATAFVAATLLASTVRRSARR